MDAVRIDTATAGDIPALVELLGLLFAIEQDFTPDAEKQRRGLAALLASPDGHIAVARDATGRVLGMVTAQLLMSTAEGAPSAWIEDVVIHAPWRGTGLGRRLLDAALDWARSRGACRAQLLVDLDNDPALAFYDRLGWQATRLGMRRRLLPL